MQWQALVAQAIVARHPALADGLDATDVARGCNEVISRWLVQQGMADMPGTLTFHEAFFETQDAVTMHLALEMPCWRLFMREAVERAEAAVPGLGWMLVSVLDELAVHLSIFTPWVVSNLGPYTTWYGAESDEEFLKEVANHEDEELTEAQVAEYFKPSDYDKSFSDERVLKQSDRPTLRRKKLHRLAAKHQDPWIRELSAVLLRGSRLDGHVQMRLREEGAHWQPLEPMALVRWDEGDAMPHIIDEFVQDQWNSGEADPYEFLLSIADPTAAAMAIEHFESGFLRLKLFEDLAHFLKDFDEP